MALTLGLMDTGILFWIAIFASVMLALYSLARSKGNHEAGKSSHWVGISVVGGVTGLGRIQPPGNRSVALLGQAETSRLQARNEATTIRR